LGRNAALKIAGKGIDIIITYLSNKEKADEVVAEIIKTGRKATIFSWTPAKQNNLHTLQKS